MPAGYLIAIIHDITDPSGFDEYGTATGPVLEKFGAKVLARGLRDEGFEVVYTGLRQTPDMVVTAALQEDADVVGLSILSGAHMTLVPKVTAKLKEAGMDDVLVVVGGIIPDDDQAALKEAGVAGTFGPGTTIAEVAEFIRANARARD